MKIVFFYDILIFLFCHLFWTVVQSLSCVQLFATPWTAALQASLSFTTKCHFCVSSCWLFLLKSLWFLLFPLRVLMLHRVSLVLW